MNNDIILHDNSRDGIDRRGFLRCMGWAGTATVWSLCGGILTSRALGDALANTGQVAASELNFVQISDSHIGFNKAANKDVTATFQEAVRRINALSKAPEFILHTGDLSHLAQADEFDTGEQVLKDAKTSQVFYVPASTIFSATTARSTWPVSARAPRAMAGTASIKKAFTLSAWSTSSASRSRGSVFWEPTNSTG